MRAGENFAAYEGNLGSLSVDELCAAIALIAHHKRIVSADLCGDGSALPTMRSPMKAAFAEYRRHYPPEVFF